MTIKEVEQQTGISKQNIRFYEKEGLVTPSHNSENGYREYTEENVAQLNEIKLFRKLGISIRDILEMKHKEVSIYDCMKKYSQITATKIDELKKQKQLFEKIAQMTSSGEEFRVSEYLNYMETEERNGVKFFNIAFDFITKAKNYLGKGMEDLIMKRCFVISPEDSSHYPSSNEIYSAIAAYCAENKQKCEFAKENSPLTFSMNGISYRVIVYSSRIGYYLSCKEL